MDESRIIRLYQCPQNRRQYIHMMCTNEYLFLPSNRPQVQQALSSGDEPMCWLSIISDQIILNKNEKFTTFPILWTIYILLFFLWLTRRLEHKTFTVGYNLNKMYFLHWLTKTLTPPYITQFCSGHIKKYGTLEHDHSIN